MRTSFEEDDWEWRLAQSITDIMVNIGRFNKHVRLMFLARTIAALCSGSQDTYRFATMFRKLGEECEQEQIINR